MRIVVLGSTESWYVKDLRRAAPEHEIVPVAFGQLASSVGSGEISARSGDVDLRAADAVLIRTMPAGSLEQVVFRMDVLGRLARQDCLVINSPRAIETAVDKYLSTALLADAGLPTPRTVTCQGWEEALEAYGDLGGDVVCKPLFGGEGRGIFRLTDEAAAYRACKMLEQQQAVIYLQEFIEHPGFDVRVFVLGDAVYGMKRRNDSDWRTNVSRGAKCEPIEVAPEMRDLALQAARAVGAEIAGVDLLSDAEDQWYVLEVNAVPGWKALASVLRIDMAAEIVRYLENARSAGQAV